MDLVARIGIPLLGLGLDPDVLKLLILPALDVVHVEKLAEELIIPLASYHVLKVKISSLLALERLSVVALH